MLGFLAAKAGIVSASDTIDFGVMREVDGKKTVRSYVINKGDTAVSLLKVTATCGCTAVRYQKEPVAPGDSAWIELTYNPFRRPGHFEKGIKIFPAGGEMIRVPISGTVFASEATIANMFPADGGLLHLSTDTVVPPSPITSKRNLYVDVYNSGDSAVYPAMESDSEAVTFRFYPEVIPPGEKGTIGLYVDPQKETRTGSLEYSLRLYTSTSPVSSEDFSGLSPAKLTIRIEKP